jgi:tetratricopeptide (TPR) repeat protein
MIPGEQEWVVIFSKNSDAWGSFFYEDSDDALRVTVKPHKNDYHEYLTYEFVSRKPADAIVELQWEELAVPVAIKVPNINDLYISRLRHELTSGTGYTWQGFQGAAQFCLQADTQLEQGLTWANDSINRQFIGQANFTTLSTKAQILTKLGRDADATTTMQTALKLPNTTPFEIHQYGRQLLAAKKVDQALEVFQLNASRNGDEWPVHVGLARGYAAKGDNKQALEHAKKALTQAPDPLNKGSLEAMVKALSDGQSIN